MGRTHTHSHLKKANFKISGKLSIHNCCLEPISYHKNNGQSPVLDLTRVDQHRGPK